MFFLLSPQHLACYLITHDNHCYGRLSLWTLAAEERSYADDFTLFRISAFGEYYRIANKLVLFNCSGMYFISWPSMPMLIHSTPKELQVFFFFPLNANSMKKDAFLDIKGNEVKMTSKQQKSEYWPVLYL